MLTPISQSLSIFADLLSNLTHDIALQTHHTEKMLRTRQQNLHPVTDGSPPPTATVNPLTVVPAEIMCPRCHLPQHTASTMDAPGGGAKKKFCPRLPWQNAPLHDIYGNPFPTIKDKNNKNGADKNNNSFAATDSPAEDVPGVVVSGKKGTTGVVYFKCTSCDNEKVLSSRYAAHLEKCLGLAGRKSSRAAMAKMNSNSGSGAGSPMLSAVDAGTKTASRKASPEKKSKSPVPGLNGTDEPAATTTPAPAKSSFYASSAVGTTTTTTTPKKKKKKAAAAAAAAAALAAANAAAVTSLPPPLPPPPSTPSKIDVPSLPPLPPPATALVSAPQKKRKRKAEAAAAAAAAAAVAAGERQGSVVGDDKDVSVTLKEKPPPKKQKMSADKAEKAEKGEKMEKEKSMLGEGLPVKKSQVNKFKNGRGNSPSPGGIGGGRKDRRVSFRLYSTPAGRLKLTPLDIIP